MKIKILFAFALVFFISSCTASFDIQLNFDSNGGTVVESVDFNTAETLKMPENPTKEGFVFAGWYFDDETFEIPFTLNSLLNNPISNTITLYAKWSDDQDVIVGMLRVVFISDNVTELTKYAQVGLPINLPEITKEGHTLEGWYISYNNGTTLDEKWDFTSDILTKDTILYAKWIVNQYKVTLTNLVDGDMELTFDYAQELSLPVPEKTGYTFLTWSYSDGDVPLNMLSKDFTLIAVWSINSYQVDFYDTSARLSLFGNDLEPGDYILEVIDTGVNTFIITRKGVIFRDNLKIYEGFEEGEYVTSYNVNEISYGYIFSNKGKIITFGRNNDNGILGNGFGSDYAPGYGFDISESFDLDSDERIVEIEIGDRIPKNGSEYDIYSSYAITSKYKVFVWGHNQYGKLGIGNSSNALTPVNITNRFGNRTIKEFEIDSTNGYAIVEGGFYMWGYNGNGQNRTLAGQSVNERTIPSYFNGYGEPSEIKFGSTTMMLNTQGDIWTWGYNGWQLVYERYNESAYSYYVDDYLSESRSPRRQNNRGGGGYSIDGTIIDAAFGNDQVVFLTDTGKIYYFGDQFSGYSRRWYGYSSIISEETFVELENVGEYFIAINEEGDYYHFGSQNSSLSAGSLKAITYGGNIILNEKDIETINFHYENPYFITKEGEYYIWGGASYGRYGQGDSSGQTAFPKELTLEYLNIDHNDDEIGFYKYSNQHSVIITKKGMVYAWGTNDNGQLGDGSLRSSFSPVPINNWLPLNEDEKVVDAFISDISIIYKTSLGRLISTLPNQYSVAISGSESFNETINSLSIDFGSSISYVPQKTGYTFEGWFTDTGFSNLFDTTVSENISLYAKWSPNTVTLSFENSKSTILESITGKTNELFMIPDIFEVGYTFEGWYLDENYSEPLETSIILVDTTIYAKWSLIDYTATFIEYDNNIDDVGIVLEIGETILKTENGYYTAFVLTSEGRLFSVGYGGYGMLGTGNTSSTSTFNDITANFNLNEGETITDFKVGYQHCIAITSEGRVFTWGRNNHGQLGDGNINTNGLSPIDITAMFDFDDGETIIDFALGHEHSGLLTSNNRIFMWGRNHARQLGLGHNDTRDEPVDISDGYTLNVGENIIKLSFGNNESAFITDQNNIFTWGSGLTYALANGNASDQPYPVDVTGYFSSLSDGDYIIDFFYGYNNVGFAISNDGDIFSWGEGNEYIHGHSSQTDLTTPTKITDRFDLLSGERMTKFLNWGSISIGLTNYGRLFMFGSVSYIQNPLGLSTGDLYAPKMVNDLLGLEDFESVKDVSLGDYAVYVTTSNGRVLTFGRNEYGNLGISDSSSTTEIHSIVAKKISTQTVTVEGEYEFSTEKDSFSIEGIYSNHELDEFYESVLAQDVYIYVKYEALNTTLTFEFGNGDDNQVVTQVFGSLYEKPEDPDREGYTFVGWNPELPHFLPTSDATYTAVWEINTYQIILLDWDGSEIQRYDYNYSADLSTLVLPTPSRVGWDFTGWDIDLVSRMPAENITLTATYAYYEETVTGTDTDLSDLFGYDVFVSGDYYIVSAPQYNNNQGAIFVYKFSSDSYVRVITGLGTTNQSNFGRTVVVSGNYLIVGAYGNPSFAEEIGKVYIYKLDDPSYEKVINHEDSTEGDFFGLNILFEDDYIAISAHKYDDGKGRVYIYKLINDEPVLQRIVEDPENQTNDYFGKEMALNNNYLAVTSSGFNQDESKVYIFKLNDDNYLEEISNPSQGESTGFGDYLVFNGDKLIVSSQYADNNKGKVYVYTMDDLENFRTVNATDSVSGSTDEGSLFGSTIATYGDYLVITAKNDNTVYIYKLSDNSTPRVIESTENDFGRVLSIYENQLAVSSENYDNKKGAVYLYNLEDTEYERVLNGSDSLSLDRFGSAILLIEDYIFIGVENYSSKTGIVYIFTTT